MICRVEVLGDLVLVDDLAGALADLARRRRRASGRADPRRMALTLSSSVSVAAEQLCAFAGSLGGDGRVAAHHQPLAGEQRRR